MLWAMHGLIPDHGGILPTENPLVFLAGTKSNISIRDPFGIISTC